MTSGLAVVHFQLTADCNLRCAFCGQRHTAQPSPVDWFALLEELAEYAPGCRVVMWGGEPLLYPGFDALCRRAHAMGFHLELITNGTLIGEHSEVLRECFERIYVSVDGPEKVHDAVRGRGVFASVRRNLELLRGGGARVTIMTVLAPETLASCGEAPYGLAADGVIFHELIGFTAEERHTVPGAEEWPEISPDYGERLRAALAELKGRVFPVPTEFQPHFAGGEACREPWRHLHVLADGETCFCTDFTRESLGNVTRESIREIFAGVRAARFRERGETPFCAHCSWKNTAATVVRFASSPAPGEGARQ